MSTTASELTPSQNSHDSGPSEVPESTLHILVNTFKRDTLQAHNAKKAVYACPQTFKDALDGFTESAKVAVEILTQLAEIHPFIKGPVIAFKLVVGLDLKRRDNDARVLAVKAQMQSMMTVLLQFAISRSSLASFRAHAIHRLVNVEDPREFEPDMTLRRLLKDVEECIKQSASLCDWYTKKSLLRKYLKSLIYEARLAECARRFVEYEDKIQRALLVHTTIGIDATSAKLDRHSEQLNEIQSQMQDLFKLLDSPQERKIRELIQAKGARATIMDDKALQNLMEQSGDDTSGVSTSRGNQNIQSLRKNLISELSEDIDKALEKNMELFLGKLDILDLAIERQGDRIIAFLSGGHDRIVDPGWKSTVKARHIVLALRDYYLGSSPLLAEPISPEYPPPFHLPSPPLSSGSWSEVTNYPPPTTIEEDAWAVAYVNVSYLQPIAEAIDDDGSGFVNIREVNDFTSLRPSGWSIYRLLRKMYKLRDKIRPDNLVIVDTYLDDVALYRLELLLRSTIIKAEVTISPELARLRDDFSIAEEERLRSNLERLSYCLDSPGTVSLVTGPGRIERYIFPLVYLLLKHHVKTIQVARSHTLHMDEMDEKSTSLGSIFSLFNSRMAELSAVFKQMHIDPDTHFKNYAFGMFRASFSYRYDISNYTLSCVWDKLHSEPDDEDTDTCPDDIPLTVLKYGVQSPLNLPTSLSPALLPTVDYHSDSIHGNWAGFWVKDEESVPYEGVFRVFFGETQNEDKAWSGKVDTYSGTQEMSYILETSDEGKIEVDFIMVNSKDYWIRCVGVFDPSYATICGDWHSCGSEYEKRPTPGSWDMTFFTDEPDSEEIQLDYDPDEGDRSRGTFRLSRTPASLVRFRYSSAALDQSPAKARWDFACSAVLKIVRGISLNRDEAVLRLRSARRFVELTIKDFMKPDRLVCTNCDTAHQALPPPEKMATLSTAKVLEIHAMHPMLWIRSEHIVTIPDYDQLTRVEGRLSTVEDLVKEQVGKRDEEVTQRFLSIDRQLASVGERFEHRLSSLEARFDTLETLLRDLIGMHSPTI
ncbi:hypothetical protein DXG01_007825 [Tephrocybe rancida]|nr:hypothetical protein DXG01_007825 [Tephrocybe rancida]